MSDKIEVSRDLLESLARNLASGSEAYKAQQDLCEILAAPVVERQPTAWLYKNTNMGNELSFQKLDHFYRPYTPTGEHDYVRGIALYTSPPAPVSVVLPERLTSAELEELELIEVLLRGRGLSNMAGAMAAARMFINDVVCLDKVKELNP